MLMCELNNLVFSIPDFVREFAIEPSMSGM